MQARGSASAASPGAEIGIPLESGQAITGTLAMPPGARGLVLFAHGSGSSRFSPRNRFVATSLNEASVGTLLMDLLTEEEEAMDARTGTFRFDIDLLARRLLAATKYCHEAAELQDTPFGYFGASTGAAAALIAAADPATEIGAVVSRGGRPDLAGRSLAAVKAPTLLIVGGDDDVVVELNKEAIAQLGA